MRAILIFSSSRIDDDYIKILENWLSIFIVQHHTLFLTKSLLINCVTIIVSSDEVDSQKIPIPHIVEYFDDIDKEIFGQSITSEQASRYVQSITELDESVCHIYCCFQSAQSRSAAVASALYKYYGDDKAAYSIWEDPMYSPNPYVFMLLCEALGVEFDALIEVNRQAIRKAIQDTRNQT